MVKNLYLLRHAQSEYNEKGIFQGRLDSDLTPLGFVQARLVAQELSDKGIEIIYSSPQRRAYKTALTVADVLGLEVIVDERIREMSFGEYEGRHFWRLMEEEGELLRAWLSNPVKNPLPTQEDMESFKNRVESFLRDILQERHTSILIVAHGGTLHAIVCLSLGLGLENLWNIHMDNTGITQLRYKAGRFELKHLNRLCHMKGL
ncbi:histidine phosphatase family protein [Hydrogenobacter sp. T-2]|uniref:histidine phosphatase family protein n=1 Tax=Pampinifervens diazotrophicum TaxID=1632018 RepID=UPI002B25E633|nr:histidine phosphatase family protein [Hydrogenobacter sp. T-2]WPM31440.1 histidine phosphatase family protein [Hydrogenobacter sp. T-2]